jgi:hypothetical protein
MREIILGSSSTSHFNTMFLLAHKRRKQQVTSQCYTTFYLFTSFSRDESYLLIPTLAVTLPLIMNFPSIVIISPKEQTLSGAKNPFI